MSVRNSVTEKKACLFDSTAGRAFGPVFDSEQELDDFLVWLEEKYGVSDPRTCIDLFAFHQQWTVEQEEQR